MGFCPEVGIKHVKAFRTLNIFKTIWTKRPFTFFYYYSILDVKILTQKPLGIKISIHVKLWNVWKPTNRAQVANPTWADIFISSKRRPDLWLSHSSFAPTPSGSTLCPIRSLTSEHPSAPWALPTTALGGWIIQHVVFRFGCAPLIEIQIITRGPFQKRASGIRNRPRLNKQITRV